MWSKDKRFLKKELHITLVFMYIRSAWNENVVPRWQSGLNGFQATRGSLTQGQSCTVRVCWTLRVVNRSSSVTREGFTTVLNVKLVPVDLELSKSVV